MLLNPYMFGAAPVGGDPYFSDVSLLLHGGGANGSTNFTDSSANFASLTRVGTVAISTAQSKFGGASALFNGSGGLVLPSSNALNLSSNDFTLEAWVYPTSYAQYRSAILTKTGNYNAQFSYYFFVNNGGFLALQLDTLGTGTSSTEVLSNSQPVPLNAWTHVCVVRQGNSLKFFVNGISSRADFNINFPVFWDNNIPLRVGWAIYNGTEVDEAFRGHIDEVRITNGVARYTANFTPPTAAFPDF